MASGVRNQAGQDTDNLYDPDVQSDGPTAVIGGIGFRRNGVVLRYAAAAYGTPGTPIGYRLADGRDIGTLWAAKGTARYGPKNPPDQGIPP